MNGVSLKYLKRIWHLDVILMCITFISILLSLLTEYSLFDWIWGISVLSDFITFCVFIHYGSRHFFCPYCGFHSADYAYRVVRGKNKKCPSCWREYPKE